MPDSSHHSASHPSVGVESDAEISALSITLIGTASILVLLVLGLIMRSLFLQMIDEEQGPKIAGMENPVLIEIVTRDRATLSSYRAIDREQGIYQVPIDVAKSLVLRDGGLRPEPTAGEGAVEPLLDAASVAVPEGGTPQ